MLAFLSFNCQMPIGPHNILSSLVCTHCIRLIPFVLFRLTSVYVMSMRFDVVVDCLSHFFQIKFSSFFQEYLQWFATSYEQEGQHPLTGQCTTNFRLLANKWAECWLVTQWRHGCRAVRRSHQSVCNAGASNVGWSHCIQISREWQLPLPTYWCHSKGNWLRYNVQRCLTVFI